MAGDFSQDNAGKVLISALHGGGYFTEKKTTKDDKPAQTEDQKVVISAYVDPKEAGLTVYFEVLDPDDPVDNQNEHYKEAKEPFTNGTPKPVMEADDLKDAVDSNPNDNRDPAKSMFGGTLAKYNALQDSLSARSATTVLATIDGVERAVAEVTLTITDRYSGDNYIVRATCHDPEGKPFNDNSGVTENPDADAAISESHIKATTVLTAWKRVYVEVDKMFRVGADLSADSGANQQNKKVINVPTANLGLEADDKVQVFDTDDQLDPFGEIGEVDSIEANTIILKADLTGNYAVAKKAHVGKLTDADDQNFKAFYEADVSNIRELWKHAFVDVLFPEDGAGICPFKPNVGGQLVTFSDTWFHKAKTDRVNYFHIIGAHKFAAVFPAPLGITISDPGNNFSYVFVEQIEEGFADADDRAKVNKLVAAHEFCHQFDKDPKPPVNEHYHHTQSVPGIVPVADEKDCLMCVFPGVDYTRPSCWCIFHAYTVRDEMDAKIYVPPE